MKFFVMSFFMIISLLRISTLAQTEPDKMEEIIEQIEIPPVSSLHLAEGKSLCLLW